MTTASTQDVPRDPGLRVLARTLAAATGAGLVLVVTGLVAAGSSGASGAAVGVGATLAVLAFGTLSVHVVSAAMPSASLLVALLTYLLQVLMLTVVLSALRTSEAWGSTLAPGWLAAGVITVTVAWTAGQVWHSSRVRIPVYDLAPRGVLRAGEAGAR